MIDSRSKSKQRSAINRENTRKANVNTNDLQQCRKPEKLQSKIATTKGNQQSKDREPTRNLRKDYNEGGSLVAKKRQISTTKGKQQLKEPQLVVQLVREPAHNLPKDYNEGGSLLAKKTQISTTEGKQQLKEPQLVVQLVREPTHNLRKDYNEGGSLLAKKTQISTTKGKQQLKEPQLVVQLVREPTHNLRKDYNEGSSLFAKTTQISTTKRKQQLKTPQLVVQLVREPTHNLRKDDNEGSSLFAKKTHNSTTKRNQQSKQSQLAVQFVPEPTHNLRENYNESSSLLAKTTHISTIKRNQQSKESNNQKPTHNLRQQKRADYNENSSSIITDEPSEKKHVPIYRTKLTEPSQPRSQVTDLYDFTDTSPKFKVKNKRRSSIIFDKNTFEILQRLQEKENKLKRKALRKRKKTYQSRLNGIISNINQKLAKRINDKFSASQRHKTTLKQQEFCESSKDKCVVHVKNFDKESNIVANLPTVKEREETNQTKELQGIEKLQGKQDVSDASAEQGRALTSQDIDLILLQSIGSCDNSVILKDLESGFDFDNDPPSPRPSTPVKKICILSNKLLRPASKGCVESPVNFLTENPKANSTMVQARATESPWRANWINVKRNPHLVSVKANALPTVDQEMVLDHSIVENYETHCTNSQPQKSTCSGKTKSVQKSILDFVESNIDKENSNIQCSLYDNEYFNSPEKASKIKQRPITNVKRKVLGELNNIPAQRNITAPIAETSIKDIENTTYFGFEQSSCSSPKKDRRNDKDMPSRFDLSNLKKYTRRVGHLQHLPPREESLALSDDIDESVSVLENSFGEDVGEIQLFEDPEKMFDNMESFSVEDKKLRRMRLHSYDMDDDDHTFKRKPKKTKLEIDREAWIQDFNKICDDIHKSILEIE